MIADLHHRIVRLVVQGGCRDFQLSCRQIADRAMPGAISVGRILPTSVYVFSHHH
jgi:hypothetical protein